jgi:hypothetical protein
MAEIPVERKREKTFPWIWLLPLLLIPLIYLLMRGGDERDDGHADLSRDREVRTDAGSTTPAGSATVVTPPAGSSATGGSSVLGDSAGTHGGSTVAGARLADLGVYFAAPDRLSMAGKGIDLASVEVRRVISDRGFTVGPSKDQELFVMLDDRLNEGSNERRVSIKPGQRLAIGGTLMTPPSAETKEERYRGLSAEEGRELNAQQVYLHAESVSAVR